MGMLHRRAAPAPLAAFDADVLRRWSKSARPVFICGFERSGTSVLYRILSRSTELFGIANTYETFAFRRYDMLRTGKTPRNMQEYLGGKEHLEVFRTALAASPAVEKNVDDLIRAYFWYAAERVYSGTRPLEKTPKHIQNVDDIFRLFPNAFVLVCTRDPVELVSSYRSRLKKEQEKGTPRERWEWLDKTPEQLVQHFTEITRHLREARRKYPGKVAVVPYGWVTGMGELAVRDVCDLVGLQFSEAMLKQEEGEAEVAPRHGGALVSLRRDLQNMTAEEIAMVREQTRQYYREWGLEALVP